MKKLLSLLSVLTISLNVVPAVIATNPYQKKYLENKNIINDEINFLKIINLEKLNRNKRQK